MTEGVRWLAPGDRSQQSQAELAEAGKDENTHCQSSGSNDLFTEVKCRHGGQKPPWGEQSATMRNIPGDKPIQALTEHGYKNEGQEAKRPVLA